MKMIKKSIINYKMLFAIVLSLGIFLYEMIHNMCIFESLHNENKEDVLSILGSVYALSIYMYAAGMLPQLPYSFSLADEKRSGVLKFELIRYGYKKYFIEKVVAVALSGMITTSLPYLVVLIISFICGTPTTADNHIKVIDGLVWGELFKYQNGGAIILLLKGILLALFGVFWAELAFLISLFIYNKYITFILPFIIYIFLHVLSFDAGLLKYANPKFMMRYDEELGAPLILPFVCFGIYILLTILVSDIRFRRMVKNGEI